MFEGGQTFKRKTMIVAHKKKVAKQNKATNL
jgi:hypothetical protein